MTAPTFNGCFPHTWRAEILPRRPLILPTRQFVYPAIADEVEKGALEVLIQPGIRPGAPEAGPFLATCALGFRDPAAPTGLWSTPHPDWLCAVSGGYVYLIDTDAPERFAMLRYRPVLDVHCHLTGNLLLFVGHHAILAWGRDGEVWESERLSSEGVTVQSIQGNTLRGLGWDLRTDKDTPFTLDLRTGLRI